MKRENVKRMQTNVLMVEIRVIWIQSGRHGLLQRTVPESKNMAPASEHLCQQIKDAFTDVQLGNGIGLFEAQAIDDYLSDEERENYRYKDEKTNWLNIDSADLNYCFSSLSYFDAKGMRFYLPSFLISDLYGEFEFSLIFTLCEISEYRKKQFELLSVVQKKCVIEYLNFQVVNELVNSNEASKIENSIAEYWSA